MSNTKTSAKSIVRTVVLIIALVVFVLAGVKLAFQFLEYQAANNEYAELRNYVKVSHQADAGEKEERVSDIDFNGLTAINPEVIGWIQVEAIDRISYPLLHTGDNSKYLVTTVEGQSNGSGAIFMDYENSADLTDDNTFIYGHSLDDGSMFGSLKLMKDYAVYQQSPYFWIYTEQADYRYKIFSCHVVKVDDDSFIKFYGSPESYQSYLDRMKQLSLYDTGVNVTSSDTIVTLSTCSGSDRLLVHGVLDKVLR